MELKTPELKDKEVWSNAFVNIVSFHYETHQVVTWKTVGFIHWGL